MLATDRIVAAPKRLQWQTAEVCEVIAETPRVKSLVLHVTDWPGHLPGQHVDVRLTGEDGYQAQRSYSIASPPEAPNLMLSVERIDEGEVSPYLATEVRPGDQFELRGPIGGYFVWTVAVSGPLFLVAGGSGIAPLTAMLRHRAAVGNTSPAILLYSSRTFVVFPCARNTWRARGHLGARSWREAPPTHIKKRSSHSWCIAPSAKREMPVG